MRILKFWAYVFAALASMSAGIEIERFLTAENPEVAAAARAPTSSQPRPATRPIADATNARTDWVESAMDWEPLSTRALWEQVSPTSLVWAESVGREQIHSGVWDKGVATLLAWPPALWLAALAVVTFFLARLRTDRPLANPGGLRSGIRLLGLVTAAGGFGVIGADLFRAAGEWQPRSIVELWSVVHAASLDAWGRQSWLSDTLDWPAWLALVGVGFVLAYLARPRPQLDVYPYGPGYGVVPVRSFDLSRTLAYLDSMRSWPPRLRRGQRPESIDPRDFD